jgi:hypothetical protein
MTAGNHDAKKMKLPRELPIISLDAFLATSIPLLVAFSINDVIPTLSAPFLTPSKNVFHPRPSIARKTIMTTIHTRIPITQLIVKVTFNNYEENVSPIFYRSPFLGSHTTSIFIT